MTMRFTLKDCATFQRHVRAAAQNEGMTATQAYEICDEVLSRRFTSRHVVGHHVNSKNELVPIPGAITGYDDNGKPVIGRPLKSEPEPRRPKLKPVSIDALLEADGSIEDAETHDILEVGQRPEPTLIVAGVDDDDDPETQASEQAADSALLPELGLDDVVEEEADSEQ